MQLQPLAVWFFSPQIFINVSHCNQYMQQADVEEAEFQSLSLYILGSQLFYR